MLYASSSNGWCGSAWTREAWPGFLASVTAALGMQFEIIVANDVSLPQESTLSVSAQSSLGQQFTLVDLSGSRALGHQLWRIYTSSVLLAAQYVRPIQSLGHQYYVQPKTRTVGFQYQSRVINPIPTAAWCRLPWLDTSWPFADTSVQAFLALHFQYSSPAICPSAHQYRLSIPKRQSAGIQTSIEPNALNGIGTQYSQRIVDAPQTTGNQITVRVSGVSGLSQAFTLSPDFRKKFFYQYNQQTNSTRNAPHSFVSSIFSKTPFGQQFTIAPIAALGVSTQWLQKISTDPAGKNRITRHQSTTSISREKSVGAQVKIDVDRSIRYRHEYDMKIDAVPKTPFQYFYLSPYKTIGGTWLVDSWPGANGRYRWPYVSDVFSKVSYNQLKLFISSHVAGVNGTFAHQYTLSPTKPAVMKHQFWSLPGDKKAFRQQYTYVFYPDVFQNIDKISHQFSLQSVNKLQHQWRISVYNRTNFRVLWEFASDGITYNNIMASSEAGQDFRALNLKDDLVERVWRSTGVQDEWIQVDVGEGRVSFFDTIALIEHNFSAGARVKVYGLGTEYSTTPTEDDWKHADVYAEIVMPNGGATEETNLVWLAPEQPTEGFRYWRVRISDPYNPEGFLQFGRFAAGSALIFSRENFDMKIEYSTVNYKDSLELNGFSSIANNRALRKKMRLTFPDLNALGDSNYAHLNSYLRYCRDTLKALVIADPAHPYRFTVFSKLVEMPKQELNYIDESSLYATMSLEWNEGK